MKIVGPALVFVAALSQVSCTARSAPPVPSASGGESKVQSGAASSTAMASAGARFPSSLVLSVLYFEDRTRVPDLAWLRKGMVD
ncbi:MAG: hypothetical protein KGJ14_08985, partial [Nitrospirota bacterium]|nr:hypothetical protein [Nitrospirota bacterium]